MEDNTQKKNGEGDSIFSRSNLVLVNLGILVLFLLVVTGIYLWVTKKNKGQVVFPAGVNYLSPQGNEAQKPTLLYDFGKLAESADWVTYKGKIYPYSFQYPKALVPLTFPNDPSDAVTFKVNEMPAEQSLMLLTEKISGRDQNLVGKPEEFVKTYWKYFSGLQGLKNMSKVTNEKGLTGYKASYVLKGGKGTTSEYYFFTLEGDADTLLHVGDIFPAEGKTVFNRILNSIEYKK